MLDIAITKALGGFVLDAEFEAPAEGVLALFGPSGAGKTTLINAVAGLLRPDTGRIALGETVLFDSTRGVDRPVEARGIGYVFQDARLFPHLTVTDNLLFGARRAERLARRGKRTDLGPALAFDTIIGLLDLGPFLTRRPAGLSGGERQRVALGRALLARPRLLLLDEPLAALDGTRRSEILAYLERLKNDTRVPMIYVSHNVDEVVRLADRVAVVSAGRVEGLGATAAILANPELALHAGAGAPMTVLDAVVEGFAADADGLMRCRFTDGVIALSGAPVNAGEHVRLRIRATDVILALGEPVDLSVRNVLKGVIEHVRPAGPGALDVCINLGSNTLVARVTTAAVLALRLRPGLAVFALIKSLAVDRFGGGLPNGFRHSL